MRRDQERQVTLWVVLDGLHYADSIALARKVAGQRLAQDEHAVTFSTLPTITEFAKPSLLSGLPPAHCYGNSEDCLPNGAIILKESKDPALQLKNAKPGNLFVWTLQDPDATYHRKNDRSTTRANVRSELDKIAQRIRNAAAEVPDALSLRVIISTDHGRMMGTSIRKHAWPSGADGAHGRCAWGTADVIFPHSGIIAAPDMVWLSKVRFALPCDCAVLLDGDAFTMSDGKTGIVEFTHGGLYPEEVLTPWLKFTRDRETPDMECKVDGKARAGQTGKIRLNVYNPSPLSISLKSLQFRISRTDGRNVNMPATCIGPFGSACVEITIDNWPSKTEVAAAEAVVTFAMPDGTPFSNVAISQLESEELYSRGIDLMLEDL